MDKIIWTIILVFVAWICFYGATTKNHDISDSTGNAIYCKHKLMGMRGYSEEMFEKLTGCDYRSTKDLLDNVKPLFE